MTSPFRTFAINQKPTSGWRGEKILSMSCAAKSNKLSSGRLALILSPFTIHLKRCIYRLQLSATLRPFYRAVREGPPQCPSSAFKQCATTTGCFNHLQWFHSLVRRNAWHRYQFMLSLLTYNIYRWEPRTGNRMKGNTAQVRMSANSAGVWRL